MDQPARRRGGSFHADDDKTNQDDSVQFVTPRYEGGSDVPEPLDLSKMHLDDDDDDLLEQDDSAEKEEEIYSRGRSRSRSVHENDSLGVIPVSPHAISDNQMANCSNGSSDGNAECNHRTGPLQHREVLALKKGLEEANKSINRDQQSREEEEERMAADAEKRKRLLLSSRTHMSSSSAPGLGLAPNNDAAATHRAKVLMLGDSGVGKSSLILRWTLDTFAPSLTSTVGVNFKSRKVMVRDELVQVQVWDTAGQEQFHKITTSYYRGAQGIMLVYDVSDQKSLDNVEYWIKNIKSHASDTVQVALIGNKTDLRDPSNHDPNSTEPPPVCVDTERGQEIAQKFGIPFFETSAKESHNVDHAFMTLAEHIVDVLSPHHLRIPGFGAAGPQRSHSTSTFGQHGHSHGHGHTSGILGLDHRRTGTTAAVDKAADKSAHRTGGSTLGSLMKDIVSGGSGERSPPSVPKEAKKKEKRPSFRSGKSLLPMSSGKEVKEGIDRAGSTGSNESTSSASDSSSTSSNGGNTTNSPTTAHDKEKCVIS